MTYCNTVAKPGCLPIITDDLVPSLEGNSMHDRGPRAPPERDFAKFPEGIIRELAL